MNHSVENAAAMLRLIATCLILSVLSSGIARASDSDYESVSGMHAEFAPSVSGDGASDEGSVPGVVEHCCHGCVFPSAVLSAGSNLSFGSPGTAPSPTDAPFSSRSYPPLLEPPAV